jgi:DNA modification methylase
MFENKNYEMLLGNCFDTLKTLPDNFVQSVATSPPYFSLRNYETEHQLWGGDKECDHEWLDQLPRRARSKNDKRSETGIQNESAFCDLPNTKLCIKCSGWVGELGLENTPERFVENLVTVFDEVKRVLRDDGVCFVNLGDTYWNNAKIKHPTLKEKDMTLTPQRFAIAMQDHGWYVRNEIIWNRKNCLPESVGDRFTRSHEAIWMFTKNGEYYFDQHAVREPYKDGFDASAMTLIDGETLINPSGANKRTVWDMGVSSDKSGHVAPFCKDLPAVAIKSSTSEYGACSNCMKPYVREMERVVVNSDKKIFSIVDKGWKKDCECDTDKVSPCIVLDPFSGSGSTGEVAMQLGRRYIGCELSKLYFDQTIRRFDGDGSLF